MKLTHCRSCEAPIVFVETLAGNLMPIDADPVPAARGFRIRDEDAAQLVVEFTTVPARDEKLYQSHFSTCPNATQHRRSRS